MGVNYAIVPRGRGYWIMASDKEGSRSIERFGTEDEAVRRLRELQNAADIVERKSIVLTLKKRQ